MASIDKSDPTREKTGPAWWTYLDNATDKPAPGTFRAEQAAAIGALYFPLANEAGMLSWTSPVLQGGPASSHHAYAGPPLTAEDLPHVLTHRGFWIVQTGVEPLSASGLDPDSLKARVGGGSSNPTPSIEAGPGWFSLTRESAERGIRITARLWCPADLDEKVELMGVEVFNTGSAPMTFTPYAALPLFGRSADNVRDHRHVTQLLHRVRATAHGAILTPVMTFDERGHRLNTLSYGALAFGPDGAKPEAIWTAAEDFLGPGGTFAAPAVVWQRKPAPVRRRPEDSGLEAIGGFRFSECTLAPGESAAFLLATVIGEKPEKLERSVALFSRPAAARQSLEKTQSYWAAQIHRVAFVTPDPGLNNWLTWVGFQPMLRRLYGNSFLPQFDYGRGGRGWRDLWQDCLALLLCDADAVRPMLVRNFGGVRIDGSNATIIGKDGSFIADRNSIPRTWMDHGVWPALTALLYVDQTGDTDFLLEECPYFRDPQIFRCKRTDPGWTPAYGSELRVRSTKKVYRGSLIEHMIVQHVTAFFNVGEHNLCRLEGADWNDGLDMAPERGESVAFSAFYAGNLRRLADALEMLAARGTKNMRLPEELLILLDRLPRGARVDYRSAKNKQARLTRYLTLVSRDLSGRTRAVSTRDIAADLRIKAEDLADRIREQEWVVTPESCCFNGYYDNRGRRVEGLHSNVMRMTLTGQVFPLMSGIASEEQTAAVIRSVDRFLRDRDSGGIRLNTNFGAIQPDLGRAFSFAYGEKENGAVFSHMAVMYAYALYLRRKPEEARAVWQSLYRMASDAPASRIFPCLPEYFNADKRGLYCYLTGSASWLVYLLLTQVFGLRGSLGDLVIDPQLTRADFGDRTALSARFTFARRRLSVTIENPQQIQAGAYRVAAVTIGAEPLAFTAQPSGGVRISRKLLTKLPKAEITALRVVLAAI